MIEGEDNNKHPLYKGNATKPLWFPDGKKVLFIENKNKLHSIDIDRTNLTFITDFGLTTSYFWDLFSGPFDKVKQFSINPSGDIIAFTSALYPDTGKIIETEPDPSTRQNVAAPLFIVSSDGSNLTQVTSTIKGKYDMFREWSPSGKQFTVESVKFSRTKTLDGGGISQVETDVPNSAPVWKYLPVSEILKSKEPNYADKTQNKTYSSKNITNATEQKERREQFPYFTFLLI
jgi:Tol biopolymer transport system component